MTGLCHPMICSDLRTHAHHGDHAADFAPLTLKMTVEDFRRWLRPRAVIPEYVKFVFIQDRNPGHCRRLRKGLL